jgi:hypothetical protein
LEKLKTAKKDPSRDGRWLVISYVINELMNLTSLSAELDKRIWDLSYSILNRKKPLDNLSRFTEFTVDKSSNMTNEEANTPHVCDCCQWSGLGGELVVGLFDFYCCPECDSACVGEVNLS